MTRALAVSWLALGGCYGALRPGVSAPIGHGHGGAGFDLGLAAGYEHRDERLRAGLGVDFGPRLSNDNGYFPVGFEGHIAIGVGGQPYGERTRPMVVAHAVAGVGRGISPSGDANAAPSPDGTFVQAFAGFGLGSPITQKSYDITAGHLAFGITATRFWPDGADAYWALGAAFELSVGWWEPR